MTDALDWQGRVGDNWAGEWQRTDRSFAPLSAALAERILAFTGGNARHILDIGCGAGGTSLDLAARFPDATIRGIDLSSALVTAAEDRNSLPDRLSFSVQDATRWDGGNWQPDCLVSRHGVMFFDDPVAAFAHLASRAAPGARLIFSCFRDRAANGWAEKIAELLPAPLPADPVAPGPFAFADRARVGSILAAAGWRDAAAEPVDFGYIAGAGADPVADASDFFTRIGPAARVLASLAQDRRSRFIADLEPLLSEHRIGGSVTFDAAAWIWTARL